MEQLEAERIQQRSGAGFVRILVVFPLLLVLYVLSIGPVARVCINRRVPSALEALYKPLEFAYQRSPVARRFFAWYVGDLWAVNRGAW